MNICVLTGAGISQESGLATFRDPGGLWSKEEFLHLAQVTALESEFAAVTEFYNRRRAQLAKVAPNAAHLALVQLEQQHTVTIITQNVDDLHQRAGSQLVIPMHGSLRHVRSLDDQETFDVGYSPITPNQRLRPDVVLFGEPVKSMEQCLRVIDACDVFISIGTSEEVYPASSFIDQVNRKGKAQTWQVNGALNANSADYHTVLTGRATVMVPQLVQAFLTY